MVSLLAKAVIFCAAFALVLFVTARNERRRGDASALSMPPRDLRTAMGDALVEGVVMIGAVIVTIVAIVLRNS